MSGIVCRWIRQQSQADSSCQPSGLASDGQISIPYRVCPVALSGLQNPVCAHALLSAPWAEGDCTARSILVASHATFLSALLVAPDLCRVAIHTATAAGMWRSLLASFHVQGTAMHGVPRAISAESSMF